MSCSRMKERVLPYMDGRLKESERREVEKHLATCPACRARVEEFRAVSNLLGELPQIEPSPAFDVRVRARVAAEPPRQSWWRSWWDSFAPSPRAALAASMLLLATVWIASRSSQPTPTLTQQADQEIQMIQNLEVLEDYDVLSNFEPMTELPPPVQPVENDKADQSM